MMIEKFHNVVKEKDMHVWEAQRVLNKIDPRGPFQDTS